jgi:DNA-binding NarL/FixJ family response regulator
MTDKPLSIAVVEDDARFRASMTVLLQTIPEVRLSATYPAAEPMLAVAERACRRNDAAPWDVVLMDLGLPGASGMEATQHLKTFFPHVHVIALTVFEDPRIVLEAICSGVDGYLLKEATATELQEQLQLVARNGATISPRLAGTVLKLVRLSAANETAWRAGADLGMTDRQLAVLRALAAGQSYRGIGETLGMSIDTVRTHIRHIYSALQVRSAAHAVSQALSRGLL